MLRDCSTTAAAAAPPPSADDEPGEAQPTEAELTEIDLTETEPSVHERDELVPIESEPSVTESRDAGPSESESHEVEPAEADSCETESLKVRSRVHGIGAASPGLLRRRYSAPETIMRKYRVAQQLSDSEGLCGGSVTPTARLGAVAPSRELMRRDALLRRLWGRHAPYAPSTPPSCCYCARSDETLVCGRASRSLDGSHSELPTPFRAERRPIFLPECSSPTLPDLDLLAQLPSDLGLHDMARPDFHDSSRTLYEPQHSNRSTSSCGSDSAQPSEALHTLICDISTREDYELRATVPTSPPPYELLEVVVSETFHVESPPRRTAAPALSTGPLSHAGRHLDLDRYVSDILVESLNSLTDQLESMNATIGDRKISIVEKEIKVRLQNTGVNTVVHLSPTSNNQIIFGNEELYERDNCNDVLFTTETADTPSGDIGTTCHELHNNASRPVLRQIRRLFDDGLSTPPAARVVASYIDSYAVESVTSATTDVQDLCAPRSVSMEVNSSSEDAGSPCTSLVDSLEDPNSPRAPVRRPIRGPRAALARSAVDVLDLPPVPSAVSPVPPPRTPPGVDRGRVFFIRINDDVDDDCECERENVIVADRMPEKIKRRLQRRQRRRELRMECARRGRRGGRDEVRRQCAALVVALVDDVIAKVAREEYRCMRVRRRGLSPGVRSDPDPCRERAENFHSDVDRDRFGRVSSFAPAREISRGRGSRRMYRESEIRAGGGCVEILEILDCAEASRSSSEPASDESAGAVRARRSRIPVPVAEPRRALRPVVGEISSACERAIEVIPEERGDDSPARRTTSPTPSSRVGGVRNATTSPPREHERGTRSIAVGVSPGNRSHPRPAEPLAPRGTTPAVGSPTSFRPAVLAPGPGPGTDEGRARGGRGRVVLVDLSPVLNR